MNEEELRNKLDTYEFWGLVAKGYIKNFNIETSQRIRSTLFNDIVKELK